MSDRQSLILNIKKKTSFLSLGGEHKKIGQQIELGTNGNDGRLLQANVRCY